MSLLAFLQIMHARERKKNKWLVQAINWCWYSNMAERRDKDMENERLTKMAAMPMPEPIHMVVNPSLLFWLFKIGKSVAI